jgi:dTDP-4-dehydrorhamnose 3,5-epimerase
MNFIDTAVKDAFIIDIEKKTDDRGFFARTWCKKEFEEHGLQEDLVQANLSFNKRKGTLRGLHYQLSPYAESKLVRCTKGAIYDVIIDLRSHSPTFRHWIGVELTEDNYRMLYVPEGFAHGYQTLQDNSEVVYHVSQCYVPNAELGIRWDDPSFKIEWPITEEWTISSKDQMWPNYG